jgi:hypothetical protein
MRILRRLFFQKPQKGLVQYRILGTLFLWEELKIVWALVKVHMKITGSLSFQVNGKIIKLNITLKQHIRLIFQGSHFIFSHHEMVDLLEKYLQTCFPFPGWRTNAADQNRQERQHECFFSCSQISTIL